VESKLQLLVIASAGSAISDLTELLQSCGYQLDCRIVSSATELTTALRDRRWDAVVHFSVPERPPVSAIKALSTVRRHSNALAFVVIDPHADTRGAVELVKSGASDCLTDTDGVSLVAALAAAVRQPGPATGKTEADHEILASANAFRNAGEGILVIDGNHRVKACNPAFEALTGYEGAELAARPAADIDGGGPRGFDDDLWQALKVDLARQGEIAVRRKDGSVFPAWASLTLAPDASGHLGDSIGVISDITVRKENEQEIRRQASLDSLTGLPNRTLFQDRFSLALARARRSENRIAVLFIDLDFFKEVNDTFGHADGDRLLVEAAERMRECVRATDTIARIGGDEFAVVLSDLDFAYRAEKVAAKILRTLEMPFEMGEAVANVSASIGIAVYPDHGEDMETLTACADAAMYEVKRSGRQGFRAYADGADVPASRSERPPADTDAVDGPSPRWFLDRMPSAEFPGVAVAVAALTLTAWLLATTLLAPDPALGPAHQDLIAEESPDALNGFSTASGKDDATASGKDDSTASGKNDSTASGKDDSTASGEDDGPLPDDATPPK